MRPRAALFAALALAGASPFAAQTATIGYTPLSNFNAPDVISFVSGMTTGTAYLVPFAFNTLGDYSVTSVSLFLSGNSNLTSLSLSVSAALPTDLTAPTALTTLSASGTLTGTPTAFTFNAGAAPMLTAGATYYFRFAYTGGDTVNWIKLSTGSSTGSGGIPPLAAVDALYTYTEGEVGGAAVSFRTVSGGGFSDGYDHIGGFSITAAAASAIPEPSTYAALFGAAALAGAAAWRLRRSRDRR